MKKLLFIFSFMLTTTLFGSTETKQTPINKAKAASAKHISFIPGEGVVIENMLEISATVVDIDKENRTLTIVDADDVVTIFNVTPAVENFNQIVVGDSVVLDGYQGLVMLLAESGQEIENSTTTILAKAAPGEKPALISAKIIETLAQITNINDKIRLVTVTNTEGNIVDLIVPEHIEGFDELNVGDKVNTSYAQAFILSVRVIES